MANGQAVLLQGIVKIFPVAAQKIMGVTVHRHIVTGSKGGSLPGTPPVCSIRYLGFTETEGATGEGFDPFIMPRLSIFIRET